MLTKHSLKLILSVFLVPMPPLTPLPQVRAMAMETAVPAEILLIVIETQHFARATAEMAMATPVRATKVMISL